MFDAENLILENLNDNRSFAFISKSDVTLIDKDMENFGKVLRGFWKKEPIFPDSILNNFFYLFFSENFNYLMFI